MKTVNIPADLHTKIKLSATVRNEHIGTWILRALKRELARLRK